MNVRRATLSDLKSVASLFTKYREFYKQASDYDGAEAFISERLKNNESIIFVAVDDCEIIGFAQLYPAFSSVALNRLWILNDLFVASENRGKGAAREILDSCAKFARESGARGLTLKTAHDNHEAQRLYEAHGWKKDTQYLSYNLIFNK